MDKKTLRHYYKEKRQSLTQDEIAGSSVSIANALLALPVWQAEYFHVFLPIAHHNEVDTEYLLHLLAGKNKKIVIARSDFHTREMTHFLLTDDTALSINEYGIPEPTDGQTITVSKIDVVFVPLLAFDQSGNRVGYGKGFYDKFLSQCRPDTVKIGLSFFEAVPEIFDVFESDVKLNWCVTPGKIYRF